MISYTREVYYYETDRMAIVHNSNYLRYFEEARLNHLRSSGIDYPHMEDSGIIIPQTEAFVKYRSSIRYGDIICIDTRLTAFNGITLKYEYIVRDQNSSEVRAEGHTIHCFLDAASGIPINIKKRRPEIYEKIHAKSETK